MKLYGFELPNAFSRAIAALTSPPRVGIVEARTTDQALSKPRMPFYNPDDLHFPEAMKPVVPGNGGYITAGLDMVPYDHQPLWDRNATIEAGPVREFIRDMMVNPRIKQT